VRRTSIPKIAMLAMAGSVTLLAPGTATAASGSQAHDPGGITEARSPQRADTEETEMWAELTDVATGETTIVPIHDGAVPLSVGGTYKCGAATDATIWGSNPAEQVLASAYWEVDCGTHSMFVSGSVADHAPDGKCAQVSAEISGDWYYSPRACPSGDSDEFTLAGVRDTSAAVRLNLVNAG
jgi:hypothetical protein